jgi:hypothetical protein
VPGLPSPRLVGFVALLSAAACKEESGPERALPGGGSGTGQTDLVGQGGDDDGDDGGAGRGEGGNLPCDEWEGPFGVDEQKILDPTSSWPGFPAGETAPGTVSLESYAMCGDGEDTTALVIYIDALWCAVCRDVAGTLAEQYESEWKARGVRVVTLVTETEDGAPADIEAAYRWRDAFDLWDLPVAYDPSYSLNFENQDSLPQALVIDPKNMRIVARHIGNVDLEPTIDAVIDGRAE